MASCAEGINACYDVLVIGAGSSGLMAARVLRNHGKRIVVLEARNRVGGRAFSFPLISEGSTQFSDVSSASIPEDADEKKSADLGCSSIHGVQDKGNSMWNLALHHSIIMPKVMEDIMEETTEYENTRIAPWFSGGTRISQLQITRMHRLHYAVVARMGSNATNRSESNVINAELAQLYKKKTTEVKLTLQVRVKSEEKKILEKIRNRYYGYCASLEEQSPHDLRESYGHFDERTQFDEESVLSEALLIDKYLCDGKPHELVPVGLGTRAESFGADVAPVNGYGRFIERVLGQNISVQFKHIVRKVSVTTIFSGNPILEVVCQDGKTYLAKNVVCTVPLGVLKSLHPLSSITFKPPLSPEKQFLIEKFNMGRHNKVILRFAEKDVFWPKNVLQFNCLDSVVQFSNLHALGKPGMLIAHIFGADESSDISTISDGDVVKRVMRILEDDVFNKEEGYGNTILSRTVFKDKAEKLRMMKDSKILKQRSEVRFQSIPQPLSTIVTRWEDDPFACGSYSYCPKKTDLGIISEWEAPEKLGTEMNVLYFAGEHTVHGGEGWQCAHGASNSGIRVAYQIITGIVSEVDIKDILGTLKYLPHPPPIASENSSVLLEPEEQTRAEIHALKAKFAKLERSFNELKKENDDLKRPESNASMDAANDSSSPTRAADTPVCTPAQDIIKKKEDDPTWFLFNTPMVDGKRRRAQCMHQKHKRKVTASVCNRCKKFVCKDHWNDGSHFETDACQPYNPEVKQVVGSRGGRPGATYTGPIA